MSDIRGEIKQNRYEKDNPSVGLVAMRGIHIVQ